MNFVVLGRIRIFLMLMIVLTSFKLYGSEKENSVNSAIELSNKKTLVANGIDLSPTVIVPQTIIAGKKEVMDIVVNNISSASSNSAVTVTGLFPLNMFTIDEDGFNSDYWILTSADNANGVFKAQYSGPIEPNMPLPTLSVSFISSSTQEPINNLLFGALVYSVEDTGPTNNEGSMLTNLDRLSDINLQFYTANNGGIAFVPGEDVFAIVRLTNIGYSKSEPFSITLTDDFLPHNALIRGDVRVKSAGNVETGIINISEDDTQITIDNIRLDGAVDSQGYIEYSIPIYFLSSVVEYELEITAVATIEKDHNSANNSATMSLLNNPIADMRLVSYTSSVVEADRCKSFTYTIVARNYGPSDFNSTGTIKAELPFGIRLDESNTTPGWSLQEGATVDDPDYIVWSFESMPVGSSSNKIIGAQISSEIEDQVDVSQVHIDSPIPDREPDNNYGYSNAINVINSGITGTITIDKEEVCAGDDININFNVSGGTAPYSIVCTDGTNVFVYKDIQDTHNVTVSVENDGTSNKTIRYSILELIDANDVCGFSGNEVYDEIIVSPTLIA